MIGEIAAARSLGKRRFSHPRQQPSHTLVKSEPFSNNSHSADDNEREDGGAADLKSNLKSSVSRQHEALVAMGMYNSSDNINDMV